MNNLDKYKQAFIDVLDLGEADFVTMKPERIKTHNWDSIGHVSLIAELEDRFDILFEVEDIIAFRTYDQGLEILEKYGVSFDE